MSHLLNNEIKDQTLRIINEDGDFLGVFPHSVAMKMANDQKKDLIKINENFPPVCKIQEYGKFLYQQKKNQPKQKILPVKIIKIRPNTDINDMKVKANHIDKFLDDGLQVTIRLEMRGREQSNMEHAKKVFETFIALIKNHRVIKPVSFEPKSISMQIKGV